MRVGVKQMDCSYERTYMVATPTMEARREENIRALGIQLEVSSRDEINRDKEGTLPTIAMARGYSSGPFSYYIQHTYEYIVRSGQSDMLQHRTILLYMCMCSMPETHAN